ncbi:hypothetical protein GCM10009530_62070 [Microbispora corallina]|uniref:Urease accessory protein UreH-like transmembrane domain-containing protein n=1 Tax=Microbispora corallina TaxID=83302 RepID=A0ABQ4G7U8_9ACTN|nr:cupredoxin domain-containing protein [Microbispora corallina]GIH43152.1 hypothetical protein Mco01_61520 [Microbispora corallina]
MSSAFLFVTGVGTGLLAGGASCAAVQGGLLAAAVTRRTAVDPQTAAPPPSLAPVAVFLIGKLVSHALLGAALGAFGSAIQFSSRVRAVIMLVAAALMVFFALELFGLRIARRLAPRSPVAWTRLVQRSAATTWMLTPLLLGLATILLPCGVTLSMELLAVTSAAPQEGAAVMAGFVLGTVPLFTLLGYLFRKSTQILQGRLRTATGAVLLAVAAFTTVSGLTLAGWSPAATSQADAAAPPAVPLSAARDDRPQTIEIGVGNDSYSPTTVTAHAGRRTKVVLRTNKTTSCARDFVIPSLNIEKVLPVTGQTTIELGPQPPGSLTYTCAVGMRTGRITFATRPTAAGTLTKSAMGTQVIEVRVLNDEYSPNRIVARANQRTRLVLVTKETTNCTQDFVIPTLSLERVLPATGRTVVDLGVRPPGRLPFTCAMGEHTGVIIFKDAPAASPSQDGKSRGLRGE